jgi:hypothetical protein
MFTPDERGRVRDALIGAARADARVSGCALTGSASIGREDRWSDIDLALGLADGGDAAEVIADWTAMMYAEHGAVGYTDVISRATVYRVFLLASTLQVDIAFAPAREFGATAPTFRLVFGESVRLRWSSPPEATELIGMAWLHALHARSSIARGRMWQAEYMISGARDRVLALACLRHGLSPYQGRGMDQLPAEVLAAIEPALVRSLEPARLRDSLRAVVMALLGEVSATDPELRGRLEGPLEELCVTTDE